MDIFPNRFAFPRVDELLDVEYQRIPPLPPGFHENDGGISFRLKADAAPIAAGEFINLELRFTYQNAVRDARCTARCERLLGDSEQNGERVGVFRFINASPETVEAIRSMACLHLLRLNREAASGF
ncbi:MAG: hypothetical protein NXI24_18335 [bacterium]|nr:hypothetical protein [bacterium]